MNLYKTAAAVTFFSAFEHCLGFLYRIILSRTLGPEGLGVYQVALTVFAVFITISSSGLPITLSRVISKHRANGYRAGEQSATTAAILIALMFSVPITILLFLIRTPFSKIFSDPRCADLFYILLFGLSFTSVYSVIRGAFWGNRRFFAYSLVELVEEIVMIATGVILIVGVGFGIADVNKAAIAVLVSHLCSFALAVFYFTLKGGKLRSPRGELMPLLKASMPVTTMRASSSLVSSLISVIFPMRLMATGVSSSRAMSAYGVVYGMVMPVILIPGSLIGSIALVLVPELSETYYKGAREKVIALITKALSTTLLIACALVPFFIACGEGVGVLLYGSAESGELISKSALILIPMSLTMITTSLLNSMNCEKQTLLFFLIGSAAMLVCVWVFPARLGSGALLLGMACDYLLTTVCSLILLRKKAGKLPLGKHLLRLLLMTIPAIAAGLFVRALALKVVSYLVALLFTALAVAMTELLLMWLLKLIDFRALFKKFFSRKKTRTAQKTKKAAKSAA